MKIGEKTVEALARVVTGDSGMSRYRRGLDLVALFNRFGFRETYGQGFPSRWVYAETKIREINGTKRLVELILAVLDPREFLDTPHNIDAVIEHLNK